jgi:hypothetical protein
LTGICIERAFAREISIGLRDALALTLSGFARTRFFLIERFAFERQAMKRRAALGFGKPRRFKIFGGVKAGGGGLGCRYSTLFDVDTGRFKRLARQAQM